MTFYTKNENGFVQARASDWKGKRKFCILAHGSCSSERDWTFQKEKTDYGSRLYQDLGYTPLYLRYNSGLHISTNGKRLSKLLEKLVTDSDTIEEIIFIGHSMGGLVFRSACYYGEKEKKTWIKYVRKIFYLGSPHLGTHLEKLGKLTTTILRKIPNPIVRIIASAGDLRSVGIKDLRHGYILDNDWNHQKADDLSISQKTQHLFLKTQIIIQFVARFQK
ncbi:MAG: hypothetical protein IPJ69_12615 [Deltaproteobacteria bacterium]|nr:MAG: hypothetical protein IPJ69_12615 [Deltaproteobacteria bacterium]